MQEFAYFSIFVVLILVGLHVWKRHSSNWMSAEEIDAADPPTENPFLHDPPKDQRMEELVLPDGIDEEDFDLPQEAVGRATRALGNMHMFSIAVMTLTGSSKIPPSEIFDTMKREFGATPDQVAYVLALCSKHTPHTLLQTGFLNVDQALRVVNAIKDGVEIDLPTRRITGAPQAVRSSTLSQDESRGNGNIRDFMESGRHDTPVGSPPTRAELPSPSVIVDESLRAEPGQVTPTETKRMLLSAATGSVAQVQDTPVASIRSRKQTRPLGDS